MESCGFLSQLRKRHACTPGMDPRQKEHCLRVSLPSPGTSQGSPPLKCLFGERHLQALSRSCVSLTAVGEAEIVNRLLKEISPEYSLEDLMLKLKLQYFGHLMQRTDSLEKTLMLGKIEGGRRG